MSGDADLFGPSEGMPSGDFASESPFRSEGADRERAKIGRPPGARNKRDQDAERWYYAKGFTDPLQRLGELVSEDPRVLRAWFRDHAEIDEDGRPKGVPSLLEVVRMQIAAAGELMPYLHGKKPIDVNVSDERLPTLILAMGTNQLDQARTIEGRRALSIGAPEPDDQGEAEASEIKDLGEGEQ